MTISIHETLLDELKHQNDFQTKIIYDYSQCDKQKRGLVKED